MYDKKLKNYEYENLLEDYVDLFFIEYVYCSICMVLLWSLFISGVLLLVYKFRG